MLLARPVIYLAAFAPTRIERRTRYVVAWFGPRGLSSLLLALLPVFAGAKEGREIFRLTCLVVLLSILVHGGALVWLGRRAAAQRRPPGARRPCARPATAAADPELITIGEVQALLASARRSCPSTCAGTTRARRAAIQAHGLAPPLAAARGGGCAPARLPADAWLVAYCTCPNEETSARVTRDLHRAGAGRAPARSSAASTPGAPPACRSSRSPSDVSRLACRCERSSTVLLLLAAAVNLIPVAGALSTSRLEGLYGVVVQDPNLEVLMRHRAVLFAIVAGLLAAAAFHPPLRALAIAAGLVSMLSFVAIAGLVGEYNPLLRRVVLTDVAASVALVAAGLLDWLSVTRRPAPQTSSSRSSRSSTPASWCSRCSSGPRPTACGRSD